MKNSFKGCLKLDSSLCFYLYDYVSVSHNLKASTDLKKTINLLFRMKGDHIVSLTAKLFSLAMSRIYIITDKKDTSILISIPAYPQQAHATIFIFLPSAVRKTGIRNSYNAIQIESGREELKGIRSVDKIFNLKFNPSLFCDKQVILIEISLIPKPALSKSKKLINLSAQYQSFFYVKNNRGRVSR